jgi:cobalt-zinc-cadmium efflux system membrane fusion protein
MSRTVVPAGRTGRRAWTPIGALTIVAMVTACGETPGESPPPPPAGTAPSNSVAMSQRQIERAGIRWETVHEATITAETQIPGQLGPDEDRSAQVGAPALARIVTVHVGVGDRVSRGQRLISLQSEQATLARAAYAKATAELSAHRSAARYARAALDRSERLFELKAVSRQDVERARVDNEEADAARIAAEAEVERTRTTLDQLGVDPSTGALILHAPLSGTVLSRDAVAGRVVDAGALLVTITDPATLWLHIAAPERVAPALRSGARVRFSVAELAPETFEATVENIGGALDPTTRTLPVRARVSNRTGRLRPAMFATVIVPLGDPQTGITIQPAAVQLLDGRSVVFVAQPDDAGGALFERRDVETGLRTSNEVQIVKGLNPGDVVVTEGAFLIKSEVARSASPAN